MSMSSRRLVRERVRGTHTPPVLTAAHTVYTGFGTANPNASWSTDASAVSLGTAFFVNTTGIFLTAYRIWKPAGAPAGSSTTPLQFALFGAGTAGATGTAKTGTTTTGTATSFGAWNRFPLTTPYALTANTTYYAEYWSAAANGGYPALAFKFNAQVDATPIVFPNDGGQGGTVRNGGFTYGGTFPQPVGNSFHAAWYGIDIEVST